MIETTCFRIVQEALTNVVRHVRARVVWIELRQRGVNIELTVSDDGIGFDRDQVRRRSLQGRSSGILGMEERMRLAGGKFEVCTQPRQGARISVVLPCRARSEGAEDAHLSVTLDGKVKPKRRKANRKREVSATGALR